MTYSLGGPAGKTVCEEAALAAGAGWLDSGGRAAGKAEKEPRPVVGTVPELGGMLISRCLGMGTGLNVPVGSVERGLRLGGAVPVSESVCLGL